MILGKHSHEPALHIGDSVIEISGFLNILGVCIDDKLKTTYQLFQGRSMSKFGSSETT